ncbi:MAG: hypothetical protein ACJAYU_005166 [Bradymonadia bacterium]|jgi:hypothetical protein
MNTQTIALGTLASALAILSVGCRPDAGPSDYESQEDFAFAEEDTGPTEFLAGPDPYLAGEDRLSIGAFYEGDFSQLVLVDDVTTHVYIYDGTMRLVPDSERLEGEESIGVEHAGLAWWGGGVHWDAADSLAPWTTLHISLRSSSNTFATVELGMNDEAGTYTVQAEDYGWEADGEWKTLTIPLADFASAGLNTSAVTAPLVMLGTAGENGDLLLVDNVYFTVP